MQNKNYAYKTGYVAYYVVNKTTMQEKAIYSGFGVS